MDKKKRNIIISSSIAAVLIVTLVTTLVCVLGKKTAELYTLNFYVGEEIVETRMVEEGSTLTEVPTVPEKVGYIGSWDRTDFTNIKQDGDVHAVYTVKVFDVRFYVDDTLFETKKVNYGDTLTDIPTAPAKDGFVGKWNRTTFENVTSDLTVNAVYRAETDLEIAVAFYVDGTLFDTKTIVFGGSLTDVPAVPEKVGYTAKWSVTNFDDINEDTRVDAVYQIIVINIRFYANDLLIVTKNVNYGGTLADIPEVPTKTGYTGRWDKTDFSDLTADVDVNALYDAITLEIKFYSDIEEQNLVDTKTVVYDATLVDIPNVPAVVGKVGAWDRTVFSNITANVNVHAVYTTRVLEIKFYVDDELYTTETVDYGADLEIVPEVPYRERYVGTWDATDFTMLTDDMTVNAVYEAEVFTYDEYPDSIVITGLVDKTQSSVTIPVTLKGKPVTKIAENAFSNGLDEYPNLVSITFAENSNVETIGNSAFYYSHIESITVPKSVKTLDEGAFYCGGFETIEFEDGFEIEMIDKQVFYSCTQLKNITIPNGVTIICDEAFKGCSSLERITLPDGVRYVGYMAFNLCSSLESIVIPKSLSIVCSSAFYYCNALTTVYYGGTAEDWDYIEIENNPTNNDKLINANRYYYVEDPTEEGRFWHNVNQEAVVWEYFVTFYVDDVLYATKGVNANKTLDSIPAAPEKVGFTGKWNKTDYTNITATTRVDAVYDVRVLAIKFYAGEELVATKQVNYGENLIDIPSAPTNDPFAGVWDITDYTNITEDIEVHAVKDILDISFYVGEELVATRQVERGQTLADIPAAPTAIPYDGTWEITDFTTLMTNLDVHANIITLSVEFYVDGDLYATRYVKYGGSLTSDDDRPVVPVKAGYIGSWGDVRFYEITTDLEVTAVYEDECWNYIENEYNIVITGTKVENVNNLSIPATINGKPVTAIGESAFKAYNKLQTIVIPDSITTIGDSAFEGCVLIENITLPENVESIGKSAFKTCVKLKTITFAENSNLQTIGESAFENCLGIMSITIPKSVKQIEKRTFRACTSLTTVGFEENSGLVSLGSAVFSKCSSLGGINLPDGITNISDSLFYECSSLATVVLPANVEIIDNYAFHGCSALGSITIPNSVTQIKQNAFSECSGLASVEFGEDSQLCELGIMAFDKCASLKGITLPNGMSVIRLYAFRDCVSLETITIPSNIEELDSAIFSGCTSLKTVLFAEHSMLTVIKGSVFEDCSSLENITLPSGVKTLGSYVFENCTSLKSIVIPESVTSLGLCFRNCTSLEQITLSSKINRILSYTFENCVSLVSVDMPYDVVSIERGAFKGCANLTHITITRKWQNGLTISADVFANCSNFESISYDHTMETWNKRTTLKENWAYNTADSTIVVHCTDGDVVLNVYPDPNN